jgi:hypothetical protein
VNVKLLHYCKELTLFARVVTVTVCAVEAVAAYHNAMQCIVEQVPSVSASTTACYLQTTNVGHIPHKINARCNAAQCAKQATLYTSV